MQDQTTIRVITAQAAGYGLQGLLSVQIGPAEALVTREQALELLGELAAELLGTAPADEDRPMGRALGDLLETMSEAITRRNEV